MSTKRSDTANIAAMNNERGAETSEIQLMADRVETTRRSRTNTETPEQIEETREAEQAGMTGTPENRKGIRHVQERHEEART